MSLQSTFDIYDMTKTPDYLPVGILEQDLVHWLDNAFLAGHVEQGGILFRGALPDYPFIHQEGAFEVLYDVQDVKSKSISNKPCMSSSSLTAVVSFLKGDCFRKSIPWVKLLFMMPCIFR
jgi:uncharacterized protein YhdP